MSIHSVPIVLVLHTKMCADLDSTINTLNNEMESLHMYACNNLVGMVQYVRGGTKQSTPPDPNVHVCLCS